MHNIDNNICRLCEGGNHKNILSNLVTKYGECYSLTKCDYCSFVSTYPIPPEDVLQRYYGQNYWPSGKLKTNAVLNTLYKLRMTKIVTYIRKNSSLDSKILDWGCGDGAFLKLIQALGYDCFGIDAYTADSSNPKIIQATIDSTEFPDGFFDVITCFHVLEHLNDPLRSIKSALRLLKINGLMIVEVPNLRSLGFQMFKSRWQPLEIPTHLNHFTSNTLQKIFESVGKTQIVRTEYFAHRISPSALVLSAFSSLSPKKIRAKYSGRYPLPLMGLYSILQLLAYPLAVLSSLIHHGEIVRIYVRKSG